jgi:hypothetical protein
MFYRLRERLGRSYFAWRTQGIYATPPLELSQEGPVVLSQLCHKDVGLYLIALKAFARQVPIGQVVILDDGSLSSSDRKLLKAHIPQGQVYSGLAFRHPTCPQGGTWERLLAISRWNQDAYVIQLDSDTLTRGPLPEVLRCLEENTSFILGTWDGQKIEPMRMVSERVQKRHPNAQALHVQLACEAAFTGLGAVDELKYVRGCSGFCGFAPGTCNLNFILSFSQAMEKLLGAKWHQWGSEQVMVNVLVANAPQVEVLPHPDYSDCLKMTETTRFIHFIGSCRFRSGRYAEEARKVIADLRALNDAA